MNFLVRFFRKLLGRRGVSFEKIGEMEGCFAEKKVLGGRWDDRAMKQVLAEQSEIKKPVSKGTRRRRRIRRETRRINREVNRQRRLKG